MQLKKQLIRQKIFLLLVFPAFAFNGLQLQEVGDFYHKY